MNTDSSSDNIVAQTAFILDAEQIREVAEDAAIRTGLSWFKENRVIALDGDELRLWALVEDEQSEEELSCALSYSEAGGLLAECECAHTHPGLCAHVVAVLHAYANQSVGETLAGALDTAITVRVKRGRTEVDVETDGDTWFGVGGEGGAGGGGGGGVGGVGGVRCGGGGGGDGGGGCLRRNGLYVELM